MLAVDLIPRDVSYDPILSKQHGGAAGGFRAIVEGLTHVHPTATRNALIFFLFPPSFLFISLQRGCSNPRFHKKKKAPGRFTVSEHIDNQVCVCVCAVRGQQRMRRGGRELEMLSPNNPSPRGIRYPVQNYAKKIT